MQIKCGAVFVKDHSVSRFLREQARAGILRLHVK